MLLLHIGEQHLRFAYDFFKLVNNIEHFNSQKSTVHGIYISNTCARHRVVNGIDL